MHRARQRTVRLRSFVSGLLPLGPRVGRVGPQVRDVAVLGERLAGAREIAASHQPGVQRVQQRAADLADLRGPDCRLDSPADIPEIALPRRHVPPGRRHVLVEQLGNRDGRVGLPSRCGLREQLAELDLRRPLGLACLPQPDLPTRQWVGRDIHLHSPRSARQLLSVSTRGANHDGTPDHRYRSTIRSTKLWRNRCFRSGAGGARTHDRRIMRTTAPRIGRASCTDDTDHRTDGTRCAGIIQRAGPRTGPRRVAGSIP